MDATQDQLIAIIARLIEFGQLRERHGEDTIGVLMKCGAFHEFGTAKGPPFSPVHRGGSSGDPDDPLVDLAAAVEAVEYKGKPLMTITHYVAGVQACLSQREKGFHESPTSAPGSPERRAWERGWKRAEDGWGKRR